MPTRCRYLLDSKEEQHVECGICLETCRSPQALLDCLHTFCESCLRTAETNYWNMNWAISGYDSEDQFPCPVCREWTRTKVRNRQMEYFIDHLAAVTCTSCATKCKGFDAFRKHNCRTAPTQAAATEDDSTNEAHSLRIAAWLLEIDLGCANNSLQCSERREAKLRVENEELRRELGRDRSRSRNNKARGGHRQRRW